MKSEAIIITILLISSLVIGILGCSKSEVLMIDEEKEEVYVPRRVKSDTTDVEGSVPITFSVSVEGWKEVVINEGN
jgi:hypothetical protein